MGKTTRKFRSGGVRDIRRFGLCSSISTGMWLDTLYLVRLAPEEPAYEVSDPEVRSAWAKLHAQIYEVDPLELSRGSHLKDFAVEGTETLYYE